MHNAIDFNGTLDPIDDTYLGFCWRDDATHPLTPCNAERQCPGEAEVCLPYTVAGNVDEPVQVEHLCHNAWVWDDVTQVPSKMVGEATDSWTECVELRTVEDETGQSYCSALCASDAGCQSPDAAVTLTCQEQGLFERPDDALSGKTGFCDF